MRKDKNELGLVLSHIDGMYTSYDSSAEEKFLINHSIGEVRTKPMKIGAIRKTMQPGNSLEQKPIVE